MNKKSPLIVSVAAALLLAGCSSVSAGTQAVEVDSWGDPVVSDCAKEETQVGTFSVDLYRYPARQISWDATNDAGAERGPYDVLSKDQAYMKVPLTIQFDLTTDCDRLKQFHRDYGTKYQGWLNEDGSVSEGWKQLLTYVISQPAEIALTAISRNYDYQKIWNDDAVRVQYQTDLLAKLPEESKRRTGGVDYFTNFRVDVLKPYPSSDQVRNAKEGEISAAAEARAAETKATADANARQKAAEAELAAVNAEVATEQAEANKRLAQIAGFGEGPSAVDAYLRWIAITEKGITPWPSPVWWPGSPR